MILGKTPFNMAKPCSILHEKRPLWTKHTHSKYPKKRRQEIKTVISLKRRKCEIERVPMDVIFVICEFVAK